MLTKSDKKWITEEIDRTLNFRFFLQEERLQDIFEKFRVAVRNDFLTSQDVIVGRLKQIDENMAAMEYRQIQHTAELENHGTRLSSLEKHTTLS